MPRRRGHRRVTLSGFYLGVLISSAIGLGFHLLRGGRLQHLVLFLATSWIAFFVGHWVSDWLNWRFLRLGTLNLFPALLATALGLAAASLLIGPPGSSHPRRSPLPPPDDEEST